MNNDAGIQVLITSKNCAEYLSDCFASIEVAMTGYKWMMIFCDDVSADNTEEIINTYKNTTTADQIVYVKYETPSASIGAAKNRTCLLSLDYKIDYPVICFMDADDRMGEERISGLLPHLSEDQPLVFGDYIVEHLVNGSWKIRKDEKPNENGNKFSGVVETYMREKHLTFGHWCTLIHSNLIPNNGIFYREDIKNYDEMLTWWELKYAKNITITPVPGFITHYYKIGRSGSCSDSLKEEKNEILTVLYDKKTAIYPVPTS